MSRVRQSPSLAARRAQDRFARETDRLGRALSRALRGAMRRARMTAEDLARKTGYTRRFVAVALGNPGDIKDAADLAIVDWVSLFAACGAGFDLRLAPRTPRAKAAAALHKIAQGGGL